MDKYQIIKLLCYAVADNIALAQELCSENHWDIEAIIKDFGYNPLGIHKPKDFLRKDISCAKENIEKLPKLLSAKVLHLNCGNKVV